MPKLTKASRNIAHELLAWDVERVARIAARGLDVSDYRARQEKVRSALDAGLQAERWPVLVRDVLMALLEVHMSRQAVNQHNAGRVDHEIPQRTAEELDAFRELARELGVFAQLEAAAPGQWEASR